MHSYRVHSLTIGSDFELPDLLPEPVPGAVPDIRIEVGPVPLDPPDGRRTPEGYVVGSSGIHLSVSGVARYWIEGGRTIIMEPAPQSQAGAQSLFLLGSALGAALHQRALFPLHGSAVVVDGGCHAFLGDSGHGKSTLVAALAARGHKIITDDVIVSSGTPRGFEVAPSIPAFKLWPQSLEVANLKAESGVLDSPDAAKLRFKAPERFIDVDMKVPLARLYLLRWLLPRSAGPEIVPLTPFQAMLALRKNIYRHSLISALSAEGSYLTFASKLLSAVRVFEFRRPMDLAKSNGQLAMLEAHIRLGKPQF